MRISAYGRMRGACCGVAVAAFAVGTGCLQTITPEIPPNLARQAAATRNVGIDHLAKHRTAMAVRELRHAESLNPDDALTLLWLGEAYRRKGLLDQSEMYLQRALELDPNSHDTRINLSALYIQMERYEEAAGYSQELVDDPTYSFPWRALNNRGWAEYQMGQLDQARFSFVEALGFNPSYWPAQLNLGILSADEGRSVDALRSFELVLAGKIGAGVIAEVHYRLGEVYISLGRRDKALYHFTLAIEGSPDGHWGKQSMEYLALLR